MIDQKIFKAYDIRGIYPSQINEENIVTIVDAIYMFFQKKLQKEKITVVLGKDMRLSGPVLFPIALERLQKLGAHVIDVGMLSTPSFYFAVSHFGYDTGIQITASHNPKEYNGLKFALNSPDGLIKIGNSTGMEEIKTMVAEGVDPNLPGNGTVVEKTDVLAEEVKNAKDVVGNPTVNNFKIVADPANAMGAQYIDALFATIPADLIRMNFTLDGSFPVHQPDPLDFNNLIDLQKKVLEEKADLGLAPDGDGDRLFFIDEKGQVIPGSMITALVAREFLRKNPGQKILFDIRYILTPKKIVEENGGTWDITKVGHAYITESLHKTGAIFAGESSAHYFFKKTGNAEAQLPVILTVLDVLTRENKPFSEIIEEIRRSYESGEINFKVSNAKEILDALKVDYKDGELSELDGVAISYPTWRFSLRTSNTEPLLRFNLEADTKDVMEAKKEELLGKIEHLKKDVS